MNEENRVHESEASLERERDELRKLVRRCGWRRTQLLVMLLPFLIALGWTGALFYLTLFEVLRAPETNLKALVETGFWGIISGLVIYVVLIVYRERRATVERGFEAEKRLARVERRFQQRVLEEAAHAASAPPTQVPPVTPVISPDGHLPPRSLSDPHVTAPPARPAPPQSAGPSAPHHRPAPAQDRGQIVLDLDAVDTKECPMCAEQVRAKAKICRFCRHEFES